MSYDLKPRNKNSEWFRMGAFSWMWMLDAGVGLVLGEGKGIEPASYRYIPDKKGASPCDNDGYYVTSKDAKLMSIVARGLVSVEKGKVDEWKNYTPEKQKNIEEWNTKHKIYNLPVREDFIEKAEKFAEWAEKSGGFWIK